MRGFLPIPKVEDVGTKLSYDASFKLRRLKLSAHLFNAAVPMQKVSQQMQNTINSTASSQKRINHLEPSVTLRAFRDKRGDASTCAHASLLFFAAEALFTTMLHANPNSQITCMTCENEALVRGVLQIPRVEDLKRKLWCEAAFQFQKLKM